MRRAGTVRLRAADAQEGDNLRFSPSCESSCCERFENHHLIRHALGARHLPRQRGRLLGLLHSSIAFPFGEAVAL